MGRMGDLFTKGGLVVEGGWVLGGKRVGIGHEVGQFGWEVEW